MPIDREDDLTGSECSDSSLIDRYLRGDDEAFATMCSKYHPLLHRVITAHLDPNVARRASPSDLIQETWIVAVKKLRVLDDAPQIAVFPWLRQIAKERVIDAHRKHRHADRRNVYKERALDPPDASVSNLADRLIDRQTSPSKVVQREEQKMIVQRAIGDLKPAFREVLVLRFLERHELHRCAEIMGVSHEAAKSRQRRALAAFADLLDSSQND